MAVTTLQQALEASSPEWVQPIRAEWGDDVFQQAITHHMRRNLRANLRTGETLDCDGWRARFTEYDATVYAARPDWVFNDFMAGDIRNSCSRIARGLAP